MAYIGDWSAIVDRSEVSEGPKGELTGRAACESIVARVLRILACTLTIKSEYRASVAVGIPLQVTLLAEQNLASLRESNVGHYATENPLPPFTAPLRSRLHSEY